MSATQHHSTNHKTKDTETNAKAVKDAANGATAEHALSAAADTQERQPSGDQHTPAPAPETAKTPKLSVEERLQRLEDLFRAMGHTLD